MTSTPETKPSYRSFGLAVIGLVAVFSLPLYQLAQFAFGSGLYSHILLIPAISFYIFWPSRNSLPGANGPDRPLAILGGLIGFTALAGYWLTIRPSATFEPDDELALATLSFLSFFFALCAWFLGRTAIRRLAFPLGFLLFMIPFPVAAVAQIEVFLQHGSAAAARMLFSAFGATYFYQDLTFQISGITLRVAPECSGIRSTLALLITSMLVGHYFLRSPWSRTWLALFVIPLGLARNGFRIFTLGELCIRIGPQMIDSYIHHRGGPIFFTLSLIPFFLFVVFLVKRERQMERAGAKS